MQVNYLVAGTCFESGKPQAELGRILMFEVVQKPKSKPPHDSAAAASATSRDVEAEPEIALRIIAEEEVRTSTRTQTYTYTRPHTYFIHLVL